MSYQFAIEDMTWSYSRVKAFGDCKYRWYLKYICEEPEGDDRFFSSYGKFVHSLIDEYYIYQTDEDELSTKYLAGFSENVVGRRPSEKVLDSYFADGLAYFDTFKPFPYEAIGTEIKLDFHLGKYPFICYIDYLGKDDDGFVIVDHKSRTLKPRSTKGKVTANDKLIDEYMTQLYIYSVAVKENFGEYPHKLCLNCFRNGVFIEEEFDEDKLNNAVKYITESIESIMDEDDFSPDIDYFKCSYLCEMSDVCEYCQMRKASGWK